MTEVVTLVGTTRESFIACLQADVVAFRIPSSFLNRATDLLTLMLFASLHLVTNLSACK